MSLPVPHVLGKWELKIQHLWSQGGDAARFYKMLQDSTRFCKTLEDAARLRRMQNTRGKPCTLTLASEDRSSLGCMQITLLPLMSLETLVQFLNLFLPLFPHLCNGENVPSPTGLILLEPLLEQELNGWEPLLLL